MYIAHGGASDEAPPNSLLSIQKAIARKADIIEIDIQITSDKIPIAFHAPTLDDTYGLPKQIIAQTTHQELKEIAPHLFPSLQEILALNPPPLLLDVKSQKDPAPILSLSRPQDLYFAFSNTLMDHLKKTLSPKNLIGHYGRDDLPLTSIKQTLITGPISSGHWAWTVDNPTRIEQLISWGIEGIITNRLPPTT